ncbi:MAG: P22 phage major capsid protein family protein [Arsenophonus sp.]
MPNNLKSNISQIVLNNSYRGFIPNVVLSNTVDRQLLLSEINLNTGDNLMFKRIHQFKSEKTEMWMSITRKI